MSGILVSAAGPSMRAALRDLALPTFRRWADRWGWAVDAVDLPSDGVAADAGAQRAKWAKIGLLRAALERAPLAMWVDADVLILRDDEDVAGHLHPAAFQALALEHVPAEHRVNPNTGVWLMRSCPQAFALPRRRGGGRPATGAVGRPGRRPRGPRVEPGRRALPLGATGARQRLPHRHQLAAVRLEPAVDRSTGGRRLLQQLRRFLCGPAARSRPHALHFMGMTPAARYRAMAAVTESIPGPREPIDC